MSVDKVSFSECEIRQLRQIANGLPPGTMAEERARLRLKRKGLATREQSSPWQWHLTVAGSQIVDAG